VHYLIFAHESLDSQNPCQGQLFGHQLLFTYGKRKRNFIDEKVQKIIM
jgi:hypothetical protein